MTKRKEINLGWRSGPGVMALGMCALLALSGCDGGGGGSSSGGNASIVGNVETFNAGGVVFVAQPRAGLAQRFASALLDLLVAPAAAAVPGVDVSVLSSKQSTVTGTDGGFQLVNAPAGDQEIMFTMGAHSAILVLSVPENQTIELRNIRIQETSVTVEQVLLHETTTEVVSTGGGGGGGGGGTTTSGGGGTTTGGGGGTSTGGGTIVGDDHDDDDHGGAEHEDEGEDEAEDD